MPISVGQIDRWRASNSETETLEFKEAKDSYDRTKLLEYCVAISNEGGGHFICGVSNTPPRPVVSSQAFKDFSRIGSTIYDTLKFRVDVEEVIHPDGRVVVFSIPPRPMGQARHLDGRYLMRLGESIVAMNSEQLKRIHSEDASDWLDQYAAESLGPHEVVALLNAGKFFELGGIPMPPTAKEVCGRLVGEGLLQNSTDGKFDVLRLGALLLARDLEKFPDLVKKRPRVVVYKGTSKLDSEDGVTGRLGYVEGFLKLVDFVYDRLPQNEVLTEVIRKEIKLVPKIVIRELLANAFIHQDFSLTGVSVMVEIYSDRVEFSNPGKPLIKLERFIDGFRTRNERLAGIMQKLGICEERSRGIDQVISTVEDHQLPPPEFRETDDRTIAILYRPRPFDEMSRDERIRACFQHCALKRVMNQPMTNQTLRARFQLSESKSALISQAIAATISAGLIRQDDSFGQSKKYARYLPYWV